MNTRITSVTTKTGDKGQTSLADGTRVAKNDICMHALGEIDELNSFIGLIIVEDTEKYFADTLLNVQNTLFTMGGAIAMQRLTQPFATQIAEIEHCEQTLNQQLPPLTEFILPGGSKLAVVCHIARSVCRRAERQFCELLIKAGLKEGCDALIYLNRLSDLLFICARVANRHTGHTDVTWQK